MSSMQFAAALAGIAAVAGRGDLDVRRLGEHLFDARLFVDHRRGADIAGDVQHNALGRAVLLVSSATTSSAVRMPESLKSVVITEIQPSLPASPGRLRSTTSSGTPAFWARPGTGASASYIDRRDDDHVGLFGQQVLDVGQLLGRIGFGVGPHEVVACILPGLLHLLGVHDAPHVGHLGLREGDEALAGGKDGGGPPQARRGSARRSTRQECGCSFMVSLL